jgi:hypothetical protein
MISDFVDGHFRMLALLVITVTVLRRVFGTPPGSEFISAL